MAKKKNTANLERMRLDRLNVHRTAGNLDTAAKGFLSILKADRR